MLDAQVVAIFLAVAGAAAGIWWVTVQAAAGRLTRAIPD